MNGQRPAKYGHKVTLTVGASGFTLDCVIERGNLCDVTLAVFGAFPKSVFCRSNCLPEERVRRDTLVAEIDEYQALFVKVIDQMRRRVLEGEKVPAHEKVFSIFGRARLDRTQPLRHGIDLAPHVPCGLSAPRSAVYAAPANSRSMFRYYGR